MRVVYLADNLFDAHLVKHALEEVEIPAFVFGESLLGGMGELPLFGVLRVCVPDAAFPEAEGVVKGLGLDSGDNGPILEGDDEGLGILPA
ncbi:MULTISPECIES: DUF2007 domain-containing protein [unclassified Pseudoxanthomonas]|uniref:putative signal transducing protein n=1 Tax=unclassified Pseudoxanthomonas TaxID=2645906 RepID=UPI0008E0C886|nr:MULTISPECIES: DUF2007 domain-containing protein [unclassified Pseudoxanthomonas]PPJ41919.1 DUF2007 domain-containing protein [Pseudoxanthomonas sp. KAs_5_3]SFV29196.1 Putative signal transducing protein [Pseudoxanthomonas sp. YR558]